MSPCLNTTTSRENPSQIRTSIHKKTWTMIAIMMRKTRIGRMKIKKQRKLLGSRASSKKKLKRKRVKISMKVSTMTILRTWKIRSNQKIT